MDPGSPRFSSRPALPAIVTVRQRAATLPANNAGLDSPIPSSPTQLSPAPASPRLPTLPPLTPTSKRKPNSLPAPSRAAISLQTRQYSDDRLFTYSSTYSNTSPPASPRSVRPLRTGSASPPLMLNTLQLGYSPPLEPSALPHSAHQGQSSPGVGGERAYQRGPNSAGSRKGSIHESPIRDPYRFKTPNTSAKGLKSDYQERGQGGHGAYSTSDNFQEATAGHQGYQPIQHQSYQPYNSSPPMHSQTAINSMAKNHATADERTDHRADPYRSAYSQAYSQQQQQQQHHAAFSPYYESSGVPYDEQNQLTHSSKHSISSISGLSTSGRGYPMETIKSKESSQILLPPLHQHSYTDTTPVPSVFDERNQDQAVVNATSLASHQPLTMQDRLKQDAEEEENAEILRKISQSGARSGTTQDSRSKTSSRKRNRRGPSISDDSDEEGQERGDERHRDSKRCWCCSRRLCVYMSFVFLICLGVTLYFVVPRSPGFSFDSVAPLGNPVVTNNRIQEPFTMQLRVDSSDNYLPIRLNSIEMMMWLKIDQSKIGNNDDLPSSFVIRPKMVQIISIPMVIDYTSLKVDTNADGTLQELISACKPVSPGSGETVRGINLTVGGKMNVWGLSWVWKPQFSFNVDSVPCPVNARDISMAPTSNPAPAPAPAPAPQQSSSSSGATPTPSQTGTTPSNSSPTITPRPTA